MKPYLVGEVDGGSGFDIMDMWPRLKRRDLIDFVGHYIETSHYLSSDSIKCAIEVLYSSASHST